MKFSKHTLKKILLKSIFAFVYTSEILRQIKIMKIIKTLYDNILHYYYWLIIQCKMKTINIVLVCGYFTVNFNVWDRQHQYSKSLIEHN